MDGSEQSPPHVDRFGGDADTGAQGVAGGDDTALFVMTATHDLQEPLRKIVTFVDLLETSLDTGNTDDARYAMHVVRRSARQAQRLVIDLLAHTKMGSRPLMREPVDVAATIRDVLSAVSGTVSETSAVIATAIESVEVSADRTQLFRMVLNLVSNGLKYHKPGQEPYLAINLVAGGDRPRLTIADRGIGFDPMHRTDIFKPFLRLNAETESRGSGIGLTTCLVIAERHGWTIQADGEPGRGATFTVQF